MAFDVFLVSNAILFNKKINIMQKQYFYIRLYPSDYPKNSEQIDKDMRKAWEILTHYFGQKSQIFRCYFSDQEFLLRELKLIKPFLEEFNSAKEFGPKKDDPLSAIEPKSIVEALKNIESPGSFFEPCEIIGCRGWLKAECKITPEFLEALIKSPTFEGISPLFDFKFYQDEKVIFDCADHGSDILFWANEQEQKEIESLLNQYKIYFELEAQQTN